jgi:hypothetical protein
VNEQQQQLLRVRSSLADLIVAFWTRKLAAPSPDFYADELRRAIAVGVKSAPASADRVLRDLRQAKRINYTVVSRSRSLYRALPLEQ